MSRWKLIIAAAVAVAIVVPAAVLLPPLIDVYTNAAPPRQVDHPLSAPPDTQGRDVLTIAHNAGNNAGTTAAALRYGADAIEIDVITVHGSLAAGRAHAWRWLAERVFRGQSLAEAWRHARTATIVQLDLQETDRGLLRELTEFLHDAPPGPRVMVSTRDSDALRYLHARLPRTVSLIFTVPFPDAVDYLRATPTLVHLIDGISVFDGLIDADLVEWAHQRDLLVIGWTVRDEDTLNRLLRSRVDGITTDNLAIIGALAR
jgi:hypothetical protein